MKVVLFKSGHCVGDPKNKNYVTQDMKKLKLRFWRIKRAVLSDVHWFIGRYSISYIHWESLLSGEVSGYPQALLKVVNFRGMLDFHRNFDRSKESKAEIVLVREF